MESFETRKNRVLNSFKAYLEAQGLWLNAEPHYGGYLLTCPCPDHEDKHPSAVFMPADVSKIGVECFFCRVCSTPSGARAFTIFTFIEKFEGLDKRAAFKRAFKFAGVPLGDFEYTDRPSPERRAPRVIPQAIYSKATLELFAKKARERALAGEPTDWEPKQPDESAAALDFENLLKTPTTANKAQQAALSDEVKQTADCPANNAPTAADVKISPYLTAAAGWSQGQIFAATKRVLKNANPSWSDDFLNVEASKNAALQFEALKHFVKGEPNGDAL